MHNNVTTVALSYGVLFSSTASECSGQPESGDVVGSREEFLERRSVDPHSADPVMSRRPQPLHTHTHTNVRERER